MPDKEIEITIFRDDLAKALPELGLTKADLNFVANLNPTKVKVLIDGIPAKLKQVDERSITATATLDLVDGPLTVVVNTNADKLVDILKYDPNTRRPLELPSEKELSLQEIIDKATERIVSAIADLGKTSRPVTDKGS